MQRRRSLSAGAAEDVQDRASDEEAHSDSEISPRRLTSDGKIPFSLKYNKLQDKHELNLAKLNFIQRFFVNNEVWVFLFMWPVILFSSSFVLVDGWSATAWWTMLGNLSEKNFSMENFYL